MKHAFPGQAVRVEVRDRAILAAPNLICPHLELLLERENE